MLINLINFFGLIALKKKLWDTCFFAFLVRMIKRPEREERAKWEDLGNAIDVLLSFFLVAFVIGGGYIAWLPAKHILIWNISVVLNVMGAGLSRLGTSISSLHAEV